MLRGLCRAVGAIIAPRLCEVCGNTLTSDEEALCLDCQLRLPVTNTHLMPDYNDIHTRIVGHANIGRAAAMFFYVSASPYANLIKQAKYGGRPHLIEQLAAMYVPVLQSSGFFAGIDVILPVPMHRLKRWRRGYNQAEVLARAVAKATNLPIGDNLVARRHSVQARLGRMGRFKNARDTYHVVHGTELQGLQILLVDDIITTGATTNACAATINAVAPTATIHVMALGLTR